MIDTNDSSEQTQQMKRFDFPRWDFQRFGRQVIGLVDCGFGYLLQLQHLSPKSPTEKEQIVKQYTQLIEINHIINFTSSVSIGGGHLYIVGIR